MFNLSKLNRSGCRSLLCLVFLAGVASAQTASLTVSVDRVLVDPGDRVTVTIAFAGSGVSGVQGNFGAGAWSTPLSDKTLYSNEAGLCLIIGLNATEIPAGVIASAEFTINADRDFTLSDLVATSPEGLAVPIVASALVRVAVVRPGDVNRDGELDEADFELAVAQALAADAESYTVVNVQRVSNAIDGA